MNENIDLIEILEDVPEGTKLWCPLYGYIEFKKISTRTSFPIVCQLESFSKEGYIYPDLPNVECLLFPSKEQRDWSKFKLEKTKDGYSEEVAESMVRDINGMRASDGPTDEEQLEALDRFLNGFHDDNVNHPAHYNSHPSGVECIDIVRHYCFSVGNAIKYLWRCGLKHEQGMTDREKEIEDLRKAAWYIQDRISELEGKGET